MPATEDEIADAVRKMVASRGYREAERRLDFWAVVLCGTVRRIPRHFGDNEGAWPVSVGVSRDPESYGDDVDRRSGHVVEHKVLRWAWAESRVHANRVKACLDDMLVGKQAENRLRHSWRDVSDPFVVWDIFLPEVHRELGGRIELFDDEEKMRRILREARSHSRRR